MTGRTDVRLITATNRDLRKQIEGGLFREDLYYRLNVIQIAVPPLRQRGDDVLLLLRYYLQRASEAHRLPHARADARRRAACCCEYQWPGNIRELKNMTERLVVRAQRDADPPRRSAARDARRGRDHGRRQRGAACRAGRARARGRPPAVTWSRGTETAEKLWQRLMAGEDFWTVVHQPFKAHELTRDDLAALIDRGLQHTRGSYRALLTTFGLPTSDYKRFHAFLYQQNCNLPVGPYRSAKAAIRGGTSRTDSAFSPAC